MMKKSEQHDNYVLCWSGKIAGRLVHDSLRMRDILWCVTSEGQLKKKSSWGAKK